MATREKRGILSRVFGAVVQFVLVAVFTVVETAALVSGSRSSRTPRSSRRRQ